ncbi:alpha/beta hydrolase [Nonomuraea sp. NBC_01738]|uniref:alpha/beta hydrolase n=1 Tax=Nonomuraea sp. NBC_01738 TaxID=2976003 RepID=UPI002E14875D|nr:alpha/beta hydrolase [Nonomuraea sp. NBC_01738]
MKATYVLVHSPSVGPATWEPVARALETRGHAAVVPDLTGVGATPPYWPAAVEAVRDAVVEAAPRGPLVLAAHSNAGLLLPAIKDGLGERVVACVFAETHLPPRAGLVRTAEEKFLPFLRKLAADDGSLPPWTDWWGPDRIAPMLPDPDLRERVVTEQPRLPLSYFTQRVPVPAGWDLVPCGYIWYGPPYDAIAAEAAGRGWPVVHVEGRHLHQVVRPAAVTDAMLGLVNSSLFPAR